MGNARSALAKDKVSLDSYFNVVGFTKAEILELYDHFLRIGGLDSKKVHYFDFSLTDLKFTHSKLTRIPVEQFLTNFYPERKGGDETGAEANGSNVRYFSTRFCQT